MSIIKQVLLLKQQGETNRGIARKLPINKGTVNGYMRVIASNGWRINDLLRKDDPELERMFQTGRTVIINRPTGTGKSYLACALGDRACREGVKTLYFTMNALIESLRLAHLEGRESNFLRKLASHGLLIIDDFGMARLEGQAQHDFEQIIDDRYNRRALILASQLSVTDWYSVFQSELIAEACLDRLVHKSTRFELKGESLRKKY